MAATSFVNVDVSKYRKPEAVPQKLSLQTVIPSVERCIEILSDHNKKFGIPLDYDRLLEYYVNYRMVGARQRKRIERYIGHTGPDKLKENDFKRFLSSNRWTDGLLLTGQGGISLSGESIEAALEAGRLPREAAELLKLWEGYASNYKLVSLFEGIIKTAQIEKELTCEGHRMIRCYPIWDPQNTGRIGMKQPALINLPKELHDIETVPQGYVYFAVDSGQIDPRVSQSYKLKDEQLKKCTVMYNDAYYGYLHYCCFLTPEERMSGTTNLTPRPVTDELEKMRKILKTCANGVLYGKTTNPGNDPIIAAMIKYIGNHKARLNWQQEVEEQLSRRDYVFYTPFGTPIDITKGPSEKNYVPGSNAQYQHHIRTAINCVIQGCSADLMRYSVGRANHLLQKEAPESYILRYTHDSGTFAIKEEDYDKVIDSLTGITSYQVEDWIPIYGDPEVGPFRNKSYEHSF